MGSGSAPKAPQPVTIGQDISQITGNNTNILGAEQFMEPQLAGLSNQISGQNLSSFNTALQGTVNPGANQSAKYQNAFNMGEFQQYLPQFTSNIEQANPSLAMAPSFLQQGQNTLNTASNQLTANNQTLLNNAGGSGLLGQMGNLAQSQLALGGQVSPQELNMVDQQTAGTFSQNGLFNSNAAAATDLLNRDQYSQQRLQQREGFAQGTNQLVQSNAGLVQANASALGGIGQSQSGIGANLSTQLNQSIDSMFNSVINPGTYASQQGMLASMYRNNNSTPTFIDSLIGTANSNGQFNAQSQYAAQAANAQLQNQQNAALMSAGTSVAIGTATIAASFA